MIIHKLTLGVFAANCYIIETAQKNALLIDAGAEPERILRFLKENGLRAKILAFTHGHFDHIGAASAIKDVTGAKTLLPADDRRLFLSPKSGGDIFPSYDGYCGAEPDALLSNGDEIVLDEVRLRVLHTPGHTPGSCLFCGSGVAFTGDTLFAGSIGRTDLIGGDIAAMRDSLQKIKGIKENIRILPGHGPESTLNQEKRSNPYLAL